MTNVTKTVNVANYGVNSNSSVISNYDLATAYAYDTNRLTVGYGNDSVSIKMDELIEAVDKLTKKPEVRPDTTTKFDIKNGKISVKHYKDGFFKSERTIMPDIKDVKVYNNTVMMIFVDDTKTVAVLDNEDKFNLEQGISICITKKLLGQDGSSIYNKLIKRALKLKKQKEKEATKAENDKKEAKRRKEKALARHMKKKAKRREEEIEMHKEAYIRAIEYVNAGVSIDK